MNIEQRDYLVGVYARREIGFTQLAGMADAIMDDKSNYHAANAASLFAVAALMDGEPELAVICANKSLSHWSNGNGLATMVLTAVDKGLIVTPEAFDRLRTAMSVEQ